MRKYITILLFFILLCANVSHICADEFYTTNAVSAQVSDMFRYGEFDVSLFTGRMQQTIPIYTLEDPDFKMNIALHYNAEGFKPRKHPGPIGYNWFLEAGGCITREVNGFPDEIRGHRLFLYAYSQFPLDDWTMAYTNADVWTRVYTKEEGMLHYITQNPGINKNDVFEQSESVMDECEDCFNIINGDGRYLKNAKYYLADYSPDIFHFNFMGYSGTFMINNEGKVQIISGDYVDVDLTGIIDGFAFPVMYKNPKIVPLPRSNSTIIITTNDGFKYTFGEDISKLEYTVGAYARDSFLTPDSVNPPTISTWYLSKIQAPNGRTISFNYKNANEKTQPQTRQEPPETNSHLWELNEHFDRFKAYDDFLSTELKYNDELKERVNQEICSLEIYHPTRHRYIPDYTYSMTKTCLLESIEISGEQPLNIYFRYSLEPEEKKMYSEDYYKYLSRTNYKLDAISVYTPTQWIKSATLYHSYRSHMQGYIYWRHLDSVRVRGVGTYKMEYNDNYVGYPEAYHDGRTTYNSTKTGIADDEDEYGYYSRRAEIYPAASKVSLLCKMVFPTGGWQRYEYGDYEYQKKRLYSLVDGSTLEMKTIDQRAVMCGARIKTVDTYDENGNLVETKSYSYENGIFYDNKKVYNLPDIGLYKDWGWAIQFYANYGLLDTHIGYGKVTETVRNSQGSYKTIYTFDTGKNSYTTNGDKDINYHSQCDIQLYALLSGMMMYNSKLSKWGKLMSVENYDSKGKLLKSTNYEYNDVGNLNFNQYEWKEGGAALRAPQIGGVWDYELSRFSPARMCTDTIVTFCHYYNADVSKKLYVYPDMLTKEETKEDGLTITKTYSYDKKFRVTKIYLSGQGAGSEYARFQLLRTHSNQSHRSPYRNTYRLYKG